MFCFKLYESSSICIAFFLSFKNNSKRLYVLIYKIYCSFLEKHTIKWNLLPDWYFWYVMRCKQLVFVGFRVAVYLIFYDLDYCLSCRRFSFFSMFVSVCFLPLGLIVPLVSCASLLKFVKVQLITVRGE